MSAVLFTGVRTGFAGLCAQFAKSGTERRVSGHQGNAKTAKIDAIETGLNTACHMLGMLKTRRDALFTLNDARLTSGDTGIIVAHLLTRYVLILKRLRLRSCSLRYT